MREQRFVIGKGGALTGVVACLSAALDQHDVEVVVKQHRRRRSEQQNRYLWGVVYERIQAHLPGWDKDDIHEFCLGQWSGWEVLEGFGKKRLKPVKRSSGLNTVEFMDFVAHIQRSMAERGIDIPDPGEELHRD